ncbi:MAG: ABC transporter substrate-binding protein [Pseudomonadota bacterium]
MRHTVFAGVTAGFMVAGTTSPMAADVKFMMDWAWQGPQSFALLAQNSGCFEENGINITLDRGFGSGRTPVELAAGTYQMGLGDINPTIKFRAENPDSDLIAVAVLADASPLVAVVRADSGIEKPSDLEGKSLAAPDFDAGRQLFPAFAAATEIDASTIEWVSVKPELREPMLAQKQTDGITGFVTSALPSLGALGVGEEDLKVFRYKEYGVDLYSTSILTTKAFAEANPEAVKSVVACMIDGTKAMVADVDGAIAALKAHEPLTDVAGETGRLIMTIDEMISTESARANGLSAVDMERLQSTIIMVENAYGLENTLQATDLYDPSFLPSEEDRKF